MKLRKTKYYAVQECSSPSNGEQQGYKDVHSYGTWTITRLSVSPAPELLVSSEGDEPAAYIGMKYKDYLELQQSNKLDGKSCLDRVRISAV
uniref:Uncharacterized protein n=1 Tax=Salix viminalis TaxID=40686 RepID=A0A6N2LNG8_SALVM